MSNRRSNLQFSWHLRNEIAKYNAKRAQDAAIVTEAQEAFEAREIVVEEQIRKGTAPSSAYTSSKGAVTNRPKVTDAIARAAGRDAGDRSMRDAGRKCWDKTDYKAATDVYDRLIGRSQPGKRSDPTKGTAP